MSCVSIKIQVELLNLPRKNHSDEELCVDVAIIFLLSPWHLTMKNFIDNIER